MKQSMKFKYSEDDKILYRKQTFVFWDENTNGVKLQES